MVYACAAIRWSCEQVCQWISRLQVCFGTRATERYEGIFQAFNVSGRELVTITSEDLEDMRIDSASHRQHLLHFISELRPSRKTATTEKGAMRMQIGHELPRKSSMLSSPSDTCVRFDPTLTDHGQLEYNIGSRADACEVLSDSRVGNRGDADLAAYQAYQNTLLAPSSVAISQQLASSVSTMRQMGRGTHDRSSLFFVCTSLPFNLCSAHVDR